MNQYKPRVLVITQHFLPGWKSGGPVRSIANMIERLGDEFEFFILTSDRDLGDQEPYRHISDYASWYPCGKALVKYLPPNRHLFASVLHEIRTIKHDVLYISGLFPSYSITAAFFGWCNILPTNCLVIAPRGHLETGALSLKSPKKHFFLGIVRAVNLYGRIHWHAASHNERADILRMLPSVKPENIVVVPNLPASYQVTNRQERFKNPGILKIVFFSRVSRKKNIDSALTILSREITGQVTFDIYGPIEDEGYWQQCQRHIEKLPSNINVAYCGEVKPEDVGKVLSQYHLFLLPTLGENFGHVIYEALAAGCPVLISDRTPWNDVNDRGAGWTLPLEEPDRFRNVIQDMVNADAETWRTYSNRASAYGADYVAKSSAVEEMRRFLTNLASGAHR